MKTFRIWSEIIPDDLNTGHRCAIIPGDHCSDGDHTFEELYTHRLALFVALARALDYKNCWRAKRHYNEDEFGMPDGFFIAGINYKPGDQISYHIGLEHWDKLAGFKELPAAPAFDGHTSDLVVERLLSGIVRRKDEVGKCECGCELAAHSKSIAARRNHPRY